MGACLPFKKPPANRAGRRSAQFNPVQAIGAEDPIAPVLEKRAANFTERGEEDQAGQAAELGKGAGQGQNQAVSDSLCSWQSMQSGVQGMAARRFLPISF